MVPREVKEVVRTDDPDVALMLLCKGGDDVAFSQLVEKYEDRVLGLAYRYLGDRGLAEDMAQEAFLRVYRARGRYEPRAKFSTWLYRIVVNLALNELRWQRGRPSVALAVKTETSSNVNIDHTDSGLLPPMETLEKEELAVRIREIVMELPENQRIAILLNKFEDLSYEETAEAMEMSVAAVKSLLTRARVKIKERLLPYLGEDVHAM
ncbi:MAG: sigma-70 family RNA polymerase sigma factor [Planctomycetes bacterium]|nr:sigma-70 family RNA polymerase sigma factor [Planctomycetota bacterium]